MAQRRYHFFTITDVQMVSIYRLNPVFCMSENINQGCGRVDIVLGLLKPSSLHLHVSRVHRAAQLAL